MTDFIWINGFTRAYAWEEHRGHYVFGFIMFCNCKK